jgi:hypothetical protein
VQPVTPALEGRGAGATGDGEIDLLDSIVSLPGPGPAQRSLPRAPSSSYSVGSASARCGGNGGKPMDLPAPSTLRSSTVAASSPRPPLLRLRRPTASESQVPKVHHNHGESSQPLAQGFGWPGCWSALFILVRRSWKWWVPLLPLLGSSVPFSSLAAQIA